MIIITIIMIMIIIKMVILFKINVIVNEIIMIIIIVIKVNNKLERCTVRMGSWLLKLLSRNIKTFGEKNNKNNNRMQYNGKYNTYHRSLFQEQIDGRYRSPIQHATVNQVMNNPLLWFRDVLESFHNSLQVGCIEQKCNIPG